MKNWLRGILGSQGERRAEKFLAKQGFKILPAAWRTDSARST